jgi:hypothetical protein
MLAATDAAVAVAVAAALALALGAPAAHAVPDSPDDDDEAAAPAVESPEWGGADEGRVGTETDDFESTSIPSAPNDADDDEDETEASLAPS